MIAEQPPGWKEARGLFGLAPGRPACPPSIEPASVPMTSLSYALIVA